MDFDGQFCRGRAYELSLTLISIKRHTIISGGRRTERQNKFIGVTYEIKSLRTISSNERNIRHSQVNIVPFFCFFVCFMGQLSSIILMGHPSSFVSFCELKVGNIRCEKGE